MSLQARRICQNWVLNKDSCDWLSSQLAYSVSRELDAHYSDTRTTLITSEYVVQHSLSNLRKETPLAATGTVEWAPYRGHDIEMLERPQLRDKLIAYRALHKRPTSNPDHNCDSTLTVTLTLTQTMILTLPGRWKKVPPKVTNSLYAR